MRPKIGVMGSGSNDIPEEVQKAAYEIGKNIARHNVILVNGACGGVPYWASKGAKENDGLVIGISPAKNLYDHVNNYKFPTDVFDVIIYSGFGFKGRNVLNISSSDAVIVVHGSAGTLNEFTIAYDEGRIIGVLEGIGGVADHIRNIIDIVDKDTGANMIYDNDPHQLVRHVLGALKRRREEGDELRT